MRLYIQYHPEWPDEGLGLWAVWDEDSSWPEPLFEGSSWGECDAWIGANYPALGSAP